MEFLRKTRKKRLSILLGLSSSIIIAAVLILFFGGKDAIAAWFDESWAFRRRIPVTNNTTAETNVYVTIANIDTSDTAKFQADCGDIRFTKENGQLLDYYIVSGCGTATTTLHVQFDTLIAGVQDIYMYYGNPSAANGFTGSDFSTQASNYSVGSLATEEKSQGPVAYWKFDEGYGATANNSTAQTGINGTITGATWQTEDKCINGKCLYFTSTNYISVPDAPNNSLDFGTGDFTISAWVRTGTSADNRNLIRKGAGGGLSGFRFGLSNGVPNILIGDTSTYVERSLGSTSIADNKWHHYSVVFNRSGNAVGYVDGKQVGTGVISTVNLTIDNSSAVTVGNTFATFTGFLDDVKFFNYARSAGQIKADYASRGSSKGGSAVLGGDSDKWLSDGLVGYWKMDEASWTNDCTATSVTDSSGNGNNGKSCPATTGPTGGAAGKFGNAGSFDGTEDYVDAGTGSSLSFSNGITISTWIKKTANGSAYKGVVDKGRDGYGAWSLNADETPYKLTFKAKIGGTNYSVVANSTYTAGQWEHYTGVFDGTKLLIYRNGELSNTTSASGALGTNSVSVRIGATNDGLYFDGSTDDVRIYNRALSPKEVRDLYNWAPGPVGYWNFDEKTGSNANDRSGNGFNATLGANNSFSQGKYGSSLYNPGTSAGASFTYTANSALDFTTASRPTISFWLKVSSQITSRLIETATANGWLVETRNTGAMVFGTFGGTTVSWGSAISADSTWHHYSVNYDGTNASLYKDGVLISAQAYTPGWTSGSKTVVLGGDASYPITGYLDDIKIYNYARTAKQITEDMNAGHPAPGSPVGSAVGNWKFDEGYGNTTNNSGSGGSALNGTITNATWSNSGKYGKALSFDGTGDYVGITHNQGSTLKSVSAWFKLNSMPTGTPGGIVLATASSVSGPTGFDKLLRVTTAGKIEFYFNDGVGRNATGTTTLTTGVWYYAAGVTEGSRTVVYLNGKEEGSYASVSTYTTGNYAIIDFDDTAYSTYAQDINAFIDEVKIYNSALTSDEIKLDYNRGAALVMGATSTDSSGNPDNSSAREYCIPGDTTSCSAPVAEWKMDEKTGQSANDTSGNGNSGTLGASSSPGSDDPIWSSGKVGGALKFDGSNDYVNAGTGSGLALNSFSIEVWFKKTSTVQQSHLYGALISKSNNDGNGYNDNYMIYLTQSTGKIGARTGFGGTTLQTLTSNISSDDNNWHQAVYTSDYTGGIATLKLYVDGTFQDTKTQANQPYSQAVGPLIVGAWNQGATPSYGFWPGLIDNVRIFNYARTAAQIAWDYNRGGPVGHWKFDECQGTTAYDSSGNGNNGTITIGATGSQASVGTCATSAATAWYNGATGKRNSSLNFDGTDDYVDINPENGLSPGTNSFTQTAWFKTSVSAQTTNASIVNQLGTNSRAIIGMYNGGTMRFYIADESSNVVQPTPSGNYADGNWHHLTMVRNSTTNRLIGYVDGKEITNVDSSSVGNIAITQTTIGRWPSSGVFNGQIDDAKIYNYALTQQQIRDIYNGGAVRYGPATGSP